MFIKVVVVFVVIWKFSSSVKSGNSHSPVQFSTSEHGSESYDKVSLKGRLPKTDKNEPKLTHFEPLLGNTFEGKTEFIGRGNETGRESGSISKEKNKLGSRGKREFDHYREYDSSDDYGYSDGYDQSRSPSHSDAYGHSSGYGYSSGHGHYGGYGYKKEIDPYLLLAGIAAATFFTSFAYTFYCTQIVPNNPLPDGSTLCMGKGKRSLSYQPFTWNQSNQFFNTLIKATKLYETMISDKNK